MFVEDQLSATKVQYDNDVLQLHARLSQQQQQQQQHDNTSSRRSSVSSSVHEENEMFVSITVRLGFSLRAFKYDQK